uniref:Beta-defensin n=1 Tax=Canis lupus familiaris TaxID=9615 RepID=A0A8P0PP49_CANLF
MTFYSTPLLCHLSSLFKELQRGLHGLGTMKLFSLLIFVVLFISQVMPVFALSTGYRHGEVYHFCDSQTSVCLRRKKNCMTRMPGMCPGRSFCCVRMK